MREIILVLLCLFLSGCTITYNSEREPAWDYEIGEDDE